MAIKEFFNVKSEKCNIIDNILGALAGIGAYHFMDRHTLKNNWNNQYGMLAVTGLSVLNMAAGVKAADIVREESRDIRLKIMGMNPNEWVEGEYAEYQMVFVPDHSIAEGFLSQFEDRCQANGFLTVADFYDICGLSSKATDGNIGWYSTENFKITQTSEDRFLLDVPRAVTIH